MKRFERKQIAGFTLLEVLIALLVLSIGMLGVAGMQISSLKASQNTFYRSQGNMLAYEMMDRISVNAASVASYGGVNTTSNNYSSTNCETSACVAAAIAAFDIAQWEINLASALPSGNGSIAVAAGLVTVTVRWDEFHNGGTSCAVGEPDPATDLICITESFRP